MPREPGYRRHRSPTLDPDSAYERERQQRERRRRERRAAAKHASTDSGAEELLRSPYGDGAGPSPGRSSKGERSDSSPAKARPERARRGYRRGQTEEGEGEERRQRRRRDEERGDEERWQRRREDERRDEEQRQNRRDEEQRQRKREERASRARPDRDEVEVVEYPDLTPGPEDRYSARDKLREERRRRDRGNDGRTTRDRRTSESRARRREDSRGRLVDESESTSRTTPRTGTSGVLSAGSLATLDALNEKMGFSGGERRVREEVDTEELHRRREKKRQGEQKRRRTRREDDGYDSSRNRGPDPYDEYLAKEEKYEIDYQKARSMEKRDRKGRVVSGQKLEKGSSTYDGKSMVSYRWWRRGGGGSSGSDYTALSPAEEALMKKRRKKFYISLAIIVIILAIAIPVGVVVSNRESSSSTSSGGSTANGRPSNANLQDVDPDSVPTEAKGTWLDPFSWYDTTDFNVTYTDEMVGGLPVIGLNSTWDDSTRANSNVPPLDEAWEYGKMPIRGINVGGWFVMEPLITPSYFSQFKTSDGVIDEYTLTAKLPPATLKSTIETHYSSFLTEQDFKEMQAAGFDHVRIPYGYWAVATYPGDPYVPNVSWRYLLRCIEWARRYGMRVKLDMHGAPGSQNGWNHSGKQGDIGWLAGASGTDNARRTTEIHDRLSQFFAQPRYKNIITIWGLVNEPKMTFLDRATVIEWTRSTVEVIRNNGITSIIAFGDGFMGLDNWQGQLQDLENLVLDVHQYVIFNVDHLILDHQAKVTFACGGWTAQAVRSMDKTTGFGPTMFAEWSQADTDCAIYLNNVGVGSRWEGTLNFATGAGGGNGSVLTPTCPTNNSPRCSCTQANADPSTYSDVYKQWLREFAEAQMESFEKGWGWFYWTWKTENNAQWSYQTGLKHGMLPSKVWDRSFSCSDGAPDYAALGLPEYY